MTRKTKLQFHPLAADRWPDFEQLFGPRGACGGCWCMTWRLPKKQWREQQGEANKAAMCEIVCGGAQPGLLAYDGDKPVGWCSVAPREEFVGLANSRVLKPIDAKPVWSVTCLFIHKDYRRRGVSVGLLRAAVDFVRERGGSIVEGYPVEPYTEQMPAAFAWTGTLAAFLRAGYKEVARGSPSRPIVRKVIRRGRNK